jgi:hypothetical protein
MKEKFTKLLKWIIDKLLWLYDKLQLDSSSKKVSISFIIPDKKC